VIFLSAPLHIILFTLANHILSSVHIMPQRTIAVIGGLDYDLTMFAPHIPHSGESLPATQYSEGPGGKGGNTAIATYRSCHNKPMKARSPNQNTKSPQSTNHLEINVKIVAAIGDDLWGTRLLTNMKENNIDTSSVLTLAATQSSLCVIIVETASGENRCIFHPGATSHWQRQHFLYPQDLGGGTQPDLVVAQMEIDVEVVEQTIETAGAAGIEFVLNAAPAERIREQLWKWVTHLVVNEGEAAVMSGREGEEVCEGTWGVVCEEFLELGVRNIVITLGARGVCFASETGERGFCAGYEVEVTDTTGAG
jgi:ribokinase